MEAYLGQVRSHRSKVRVTRLEKNVPYGHFNCMHWRCIDVALKEATEKYDVGCFKVYSMHFLCVCVF